MLTIMLLLKRTIVLSLSVVTWILNAASQFGSESLGMFSLQACMIGDISATQHELKHFDRSNDLYSVE